MKLRLAEIRENLGLTQQEFADKLHYPIRRYQNYEYGISQLNLGEATHIADTLQCSLYDLIDDSEMPENPVDEIPEAIKEKIQQIDEKFYPMLIDMLGVFINHSSYPKNSN